MTSRFKIIAKYRDEKPRIVGEASTDIEAIAMAQEWRKTFTLPDWVVTWALASEIALLGIQVEDGL